jgi:aspartate/methionine/tyrosine aminotransferase
VPSLAKEEIRLTAPNEGSVMMGPIAARMAGIEPFYAMEIMARAQRQMDAGRSVISLCVGEPDFATPRPIVEAGIRALEKGRLPYTAALGLAELRQAIARFYAERYGVEVAAQRIVITSGSSAGLLLVMGAILNPGEQVLMTDPGYPCNRQFVRIVGGEAVGVAVDASTHYQLTEQLVEDHWRATTRAVLVASPANPTGMMIDQASLQAIARRTEKHRGHLIVDEIYHGLTYGIEAQTALAWSDQLFVINSFSKYFNMTGWRLGWVVAPEACVRELEKLAQNLYICPSTPAQYAALAAFLPETIAIAEQRRRAFAERRDFLLRALTEIGFELPVAPDGAFYLYAGCHRLAEDSHRFALDLLEATGVAITPGLDFGVNHPERHVRIAYTTGIDNLEQAVERIRGFVVRR